MTVLDPMRLTAEDETFDRLAAIVEERTGLAVKQTLKRRALAALSGATPADRLALAVQLEFLPTGTDVWQAFLDKLLVQETYLFRDIEQLRLAVETLVAPCAGEAAHPRTLNVWSAGCCTGDEAYSLAIMLLNGMVDAGLASETQTQFILNPGWHLDLLGSDISAAVVARAKAGVYRTDALSSFRATPAAYLPYFVPSDGASSERAVRSDLRRYVRFLRAGLTDEPAVSATVGPFDIVVCRNILIYFTEAARRLAISRLSDTVRPGGLLVLGPTDPPPDPARFSAIWGRSALIHRRRETPS